jgi:hypothetical protein
VKFFDSPISNSQLIGLAFSLGAFSLLAYLGVSLAGGYLGYPLDDAWIHQTYARNLGQHGEFAFLPGVPSAGSTSPLWSALLALGYFLRVEPYAWTYLMGGAALALNAYLAGKLAQNLWPDFKAGVIILVVAAVALEWHLSWAAASGMETALFAACTLAVFALPTTRPVLLGLLVGASMLLRPDGLTLLPFAVARVLPVLPFFPSLGSAQSKKSDWIWVVMGFLAIFVPYLGFNYWLSGAVWPNTFYAKQAEYAAQREFPLWENAWRVAQQPLIGAQALLLPGWLVLVWRAARERRWVLLLPLLWAGAYLAAYILRLPVTYQYGRYVMPVIPVLLTLGVGGLWGAVRLTSPQILPRVLSRVWVLATAALWLGFWVFGATLYRRDVRIIETEMVATAKWVAANIPPQAIIGAHDIGALGYFSQRPILDLAGLISPDVIPFIRDEARLAEWLTASGAQYLVTFPDWYLALPVGREKVFGTSAPYSPAAGGTNMAVYRWP